MFNPFKKKDDMNSFKLDEESLPSMTQQNGGTPTQTPSTSENDLGTPNFDNMQTEQSFDSTPIGTNTTAPTTAENPFANNNPFANQSNPITNDTPDSSTGQINNNLHQDITKVKLEMLESKISLMDAKMANMDHKLEMIYQLILSEVSEETKARLNVGNALNSLKKR